MACIIVIDDDPATLTLTRTLLERAGHEVRAASGGGEGVALYLTHGADLVLTDIFMPDQDGLETLRRLKSIAPLLPVVCMSSGPSRLNEDGQVRDTMLRFAREAGADGTVTKPLDHGALVRLLESLLAETAGESA